VALMLGWPCYQPYLNSPNAPAWVQAIGSIVAIIASVLVVERQHRQELARMRWADAQEWLETLTSARDLLLFMEERLVQAHGQTKSLGTAKAYYAEWKEQTLFTVSTAAEALSAFPLDRIRNGSLLVAFVAAIRAANHFTETMIPELRRVVEQNIGDEKFWEKQYRKVWEHMGRVQTARKAFDDAIARAAKDAK